MSCLNKLLFSNQEFIKNTFIVIMISAFYIFLFNGNIPHHLRHCVK